MAQLTPDALIYDATAAVDPQVSPDGMRLVYTVGKADRAADHATSQVWLSAIDGADARRLTGAGRTQSRRRAGRPTVASRLRLRPRQASSGIFVLPVDGPGEARELTRHQQAISDLAWSPDGSSLAYITRVRPGNPDESARAEDAAPKCASRAASTTSRTTAAT